MRSVVGFFAVHPEDLRTCLLEDFPLFLDGRGVDPVFRVADPAVALRFGGEQPLDAFAGMVERFPSRKAIPVEIIRAVAAIPGHRFLEDNILALFKDLRREFLMGGHERTDVDDITGVYK